MRSANRLPHLTATIAVKRNGHVRVPDIFLPFALVVRTQNAFKLRLTRGD